MVRKTQPYINPLLPHFMMQKLDSDMNVTLTKPAKNMKNATKPSCKCLNRLLNVFHNLKKKLSSHTKQRLWTNPNGQVHQSYVDKIDNKQKHKNNDTNRNLGLLITTVAALDKKMLSKFENFKFQKTLKNNSHLKIVRHYRRCIYLGLI